MLVGEGGTHKKMAHCNSKPGGTKYGIKQVRYKGWIQNFKVFKGSTYVYNTTKWNKKKLFNKYLENKDPPNDQMSE